MFHIFFLQLFCLLLKACCTVTAYDPINGLKSEVEWLVGQNKKLWQEISSSSEYCNLLSGNTCGPCRCRDDDRLHKKYYCDCQNLQEQQDCLQFYQKGVRVDGIYKIHQQNMSTIQVWCDQTTDGGGWTVFQRRTDGSVDFYRTWEEYKHGFGQLQNEFWLGNEKLASMTIQGLYPFVNGSMLRIDMMDWNNVRAYAKYNSFQIGSVDTKYQIHTTGYSGNAGDSLAYHDRMAFSTFDRDNDKKYTACTKESPGGWWFNACEVSNLNGIYQKQGRFGAARSGPHWDGFRGDKYFLKFVEMKIRRKH